VDIECNSTHLGVSPSFNHTSWSIQGWCGGCWSANILLSSSNNSWYCLESISSRGHSFRSFTSITSLIPCCDSSNSVNCPSFTILQKDGPFNITMLPQNGFCGCIFGWNTTPAMGWTCFGGSSLAPCTATCASWQFVMQYSDPNITVFKTIPATTSSGCSQGNSKDNRIMSRHCDSHQ